MVLDLARSGESLLDPKETAMSKRSRKRRARKSKAANHGRKPHA